MKLLITGAASELGRAVARLALGRDHEVVGIDTRPWPDAPGGVTLHAVDVRKRPAEEVFRHERPDVLVHLATVTWLSHAGEQRFRINLGGTKSAFDFARRHGASQAVFVGRHTYYGAAPDAPLYHREDDPPFAVHTYPELADLVAADLSAASELWRHPELATCVLRPCYLLGATRQGTLAAFLHGPRVPMVLGFDPLFQVMHEEDVAAAVVAAVEARLRGVFNVAGPEPTPLSALVYETGRTALPLPERLLRLALGRMGLPRLPAGAIEHLKYPVVVDASAFTEATGFAARYDLRRALTDFRLGRAP